MKTIELFQKSKLGKIKHLVLTAEGDKFTTEWFTTKDGKPSKKQSTTDTVVGMNIGKANETTPEQQCLLEMERKITKKTEEGYVMSMDAASVEQILDIGEQLPPEFAPSKPISKTPNNPYDGKWIAERKYNGVCLMLHSADCEKIVYTRRMSPITEIVSVVKDVREKLALVPSNSLIIGELVAFKNGKEDTRVLKGLINDKTTPEKAKERYEALIADGYILEFMYYDILFHLMKDVSKLSFCDRNRILESIYGKDGRALIYDLNESMVNRVRALGWEGFILRNPSDTTGYNLKGKPSREGSYKFKFISTTDVIITKVSPGNGKHAIRFATFEIKQYDNGELVDCGNCGLGRLGEDLADELTKELLAKGYKLESSELKGEDWIVSEIEFQSRQPKNKEGQMAFEFPILVRINRTDKPIKECVVEYES